MFLGFAMPLSFYSTWLPMRMYGSGSGGPILPPHLSAAYTTPQNHAAQLSNHLNFSLNNIHNNAYLANRDAQQNIMTDSDDDGSLSPVQDLSKSQHGKY